MGSTYREYVSDTSFQPRLQNMSIVFPSELHIVVAFARDYDVNGSHKNGIFKEFFDRSITQQFINNFKKASPSTAVKFYLCIGDRSGRYPFTITNQADWIKNATTSLQQIIQRYGFDGIDVFYPTINVSTANNFVDAIGTVIGNLMTQGIITVASLSPSHNVNIPYYLPLYRSNDSNFSHVVYQTHDGTFSNPINDAQALINTFTTLASNNNYPRLKLLLGHSILPNDWQTIPYPVILGAIPRLITNGLIQGTSTWAVTNQP